jgi:hypothetical protein
MLCSANNIVDLLYIDNRTRLHIDTVVERAVSRLIKTARVSSCMCVLKVLEMYKCVCLCVK